MNTFFAGVLFGALFVGALAIVFATRARRPRREPIDWTDGAYAPPPVVTTRIVNRHRSIEL